MMPLRRSSRFAAGRVKALAVTTKTRVETMPDVPTLAEVGVAGYEANSWQCILAPAQLPAAIQAKLNTALVEVMKAPETRAHFVGLGMQPLWSTPAENAAYIKVRDRPLGAGHQGPRTDGQ